MRIATRDYLVPPGARVSLREWPTAPDSAAGSGKSRRALLDEHVEQLSALQRLQYAANRHALLMVFQGMDTAGNDGAIRHVLSGVNPQGCEVHSFKQPSPEELQHDFLWRTTCRLPERGRIGIFNRSYYEEVLVVRVHPELLEAQGLDQPAPDDGAFWKGRFRSIVEFEGHLHRNGTRFVKIFLHVSKQEQRRRLIERIDRPRKNWKFSSADLNERALWGRYREAYEACLEATSTPHAPWHVVPADDKEHARLVVSQIAIDTLGALREEYPRVSARQRAELKALRKRI